MNLEPRADREHSYCDNEIARLNDALADLEHRNTQLVIEVSTLRRQAAQATRESEEAFLARALRLNREILRGRTDAAKARNGVVA